MTRAHNRHVAFGFGTHFCLGAQLARLEIRVMFEEMLRRMPDWELCDPDRAQDHPGDVRPGLRPHPHPIHSTLMETEARCTRWVASHMPGARECTQWKVSAGLSWGIPPRPSI